MILVGIKTPYNKDRNITSWLLSNGSLNFKPKKKKKTLEVVFCMVFKDTHNITTNSKCLQLTLIIIIIIN